jgi:hypothetical protein
MDLESGGLYGVMLFDAGRYFLLLVLDLAATYVVFSELL